MSAKVSFSDLTTLRVGGQIERYLVASSAQQLIATMQQVWSAGSRWLVLGGGSNLLVGDDDYQGDVVGIASKGIEVIANASGKLRIRVQAGENWDDLVAWTVAHGLSGIEALSGVPGSVGAAPVQNIGAYGQELSSTLVAIDFLDEFADHPRRILAAELELGYRTSILKRGLSGVVLAVELELHEAGNGEYKVGKHANHRLENRSGSPLGLPVAYAQLASALGVAVGDRVPIEQVRETVLQLRGSKGMVLNPADPDSVSAGSFFTNPIVPLSVARTLPHDAPRWQVGVEAPPEVIPLAELHKSALDDFLDYKNSASVSETADTAKNVIESNQGSGESEPGVIDDVDQVKLSAAWLIEHSGISRGFALPGSRAAISSKHTLALTNRGGATAEEIAQLARFVQSRVAAEFGVQLHPEPVIIGMEL